MSRSYRKPYSAVTGVKSAADDKRVARRSWRHAQNHALRNLDLENWDEFLLPARLEASDNDVWGWGRDGKQSLQKEPLWTGDIYKYTSWWLTVDAIEDAVERFDSDCEWWFRIQRK